MEESAHGYEVLLKIIDQGFVTIYNSIAEAKKACDNNHIVLSSIAFLTTTTKDGQLEAQTHIRL